MTDGAPSELLGAHYPPRSCFLKIRLELALELTAGVLGLEELGREGG